MRERRQIYEHMQANNLSNDESARSLNLPAKSIITKIESLTIKDDSIYHGDISNNIEISSLQNKKNANPETRELARQEIEEINNLIKIIKNELENEEERNIFLTRYRDILNGDLKNPTSYKAIAEILENVTRDKARYTLERFWRRINSNLKYLTTEKQDRDEDWFMQILKKKYELMEQLF